MSGTRELSVVLAPLGLTLWGFAFFLLGLLTGEVLSAAALSIAEIGFRRYRARDLADAVAPLTR